MANESALRNLDIINIQDAITNAIKAVGDVKTRALRLGFAKLIVKSRELPTDYDLETTLNIVVTLLNNIELDKGGQ